METTGIWDSRNNRHATVEHETLKPCPFCGGMPRIYDDVDDTTERYTVRCDCGGSMPGPVRSDRPIVPDPCHLPVFGGREMEQEGLMDYMGSGFRAGFRRGLRVAWDAMCFRPLRFEPWSAPMPSLREHLEAYGGTRMSPADFDRCEKDWYRMLGERRRMFDRYLLGMRCARYVLFAAWILAFAIVGLTLVEVSS